MEYLIKVKGESVRILHVPTGITFDSWENAQKFEAVINRCQAQN